MNYINLLGTKKKKSHVKTLYSGKKLDYSSKNLFVFEGPQMPIKTNCLKN